MKLKYAVLVFLLLAFVLALGCGKKPPPPPPAPPPVVEEQPPPPPPPPPEQPPPPPPLVLTTIHFDFDKANLRPDALDILAQNAKSLSEHATATVRIEGNCDERGTAQYNMALGERRAKAAQDYLVQYGIDPSKISIISYGKSRPVDPGHNEDAWAKNRRDDFVILSE